MPIQLYDGSSHGIRSLKIRRTFITMEVFLLSKADTRDSGEGGSEVAITVDVKVESAVLIVESEICRDGGHIYKEGPSLRVAAEDERQAVALFTRWVAELRDHLRDNEQYVVSLLH